MVLLLLLEENDQWKLVVQQWSGNKVETIKIFPEQKKKIKSWVVVIKNCMYDDYSRLAMIHS